MIGLFFYLIKPFFIDCNRFISELVLTNDIIALLWVFSFEWISLITFLNYETDVFALVDTGMYDDLKEPEASKIYIIIIINIPKILLLLIFYQLHSVS